MLVSGPLDDVAVEALQGSPHFQGWVKLSAPEVRVWES